MVMMRQETTKRLVRKWMGTTHWVAVLMVGWCFDGALFGHICFLGKWLMVSFGPAVFWPIIQTRVPPEMWMEIVEELIGNTSKNLVQPKTFGGVAYFRSSHRAGRGVYYILTWHRNVSLFSGF